MAEIKERSSQQGEATVDLNECSSKCEELKKERLCERLRELSKHKSPTPCIVVKYHRSNPDFPCYSEFIKAFGRFSLALKAAGLKIPQDFIKKEDKIISGYVALSKSLQQLASIKDIKELGGRNGYPNLSAVNIYFSSTDLLRKQAITENKQLENYLLSTEEKKSQQMARDLGNFAKRLGELPVFGSIEKAHWTDPRAISSAKDYILTFGSIPNARKAAGVESVEQRREAIIMDLQDLTNRLGNTPILSGYKEAAELGQCYPLSILKEEFGSWEQAKNAAHLASRARANKNSIDHADGPLPTARERRKKICQQIREFAGESARQKSDNLREEKLAGPSIHQITNYHYSNPEFPSFSEIVRMFGRYSYALEEAGLEVSEALLAKEEELITAYLERSDELGRDLTSSDLKKPPLGEETLTPRRVTHYFGCLGLLERAATGISLNRVSEMEEALCGLAETLGRPPAFGDIDKAHKEKPNLIASAQEYIDGFGSIPAARKSAGLEGCSPDRNVLLIDLIDYSDRIGKRPSRDEFAKASHKRQAHSLAPYTRIFSSWGEVLEAMDLYISAESRPLETSAENQAQSTSTRVWPPKYTQTVEVDRAKEAEEAEEIFRKQIPSPFPSQGTPPKSIINDQETFRIFELWLLNCEDKINRLLTVKDFEGYRQLELSEYERIVLRCYKDNNAIIDALKSRLINELGQKTIERQEYTKIHTMRAVHPGLTTQSYERHFKKQNANIDQLVRKQLEAFFIALGVESCIECVVDWKCVLAFEESLKFESPQIKEEKRDEIIQTLAKENPEFWKQQKRVIRQLFGGFDPFSIRIASYIADSKSK